MTSIKLMLTGAQAWASVEGPLTSGMVGIPVTIEYDEAWEGLTKNLMCRCSPWGSNDGEIRTILNVGETSIVAHEVMQPDMFLYLGVEGFSDDGKLVIPTTWARCGRIEYGANTGEDLSTDPELPIWNQLQTEVEQIKRDGYTQEQIDEIQAYVQSASLSASSAARSKESAAASSSLAASYVNTARNSADNAQTYAENASASAGSAASLANGALQAQRAAEAAAERAEAAADSGECSAILEYYSEQDGGGIAANGVNPDNEIWTDWNARLAFGMDTSKAPVPFRVNGQMLVDGTIIARNVAANTNDLVNNRWGMHMIEGYATDDYSRFTVLADKHTHDDIKMVEMYYYTGAGHSAADYGWVKLGSDVCQHSFDFRRDIMRAHGMIDCRMPITLARISLTNDIDTSYETVEEVDTAYEGEGNWQQNLRCLKYVYLKNAENGAMFYDTDIDKPVIKVGGAWHTIQTDMIEDARYLVLGQQFELRPCTSLALSETELHFTAANSQTLAATTIPVDTTDTLTWESSNEAVAIVNKNGVVTATGNGGCIITATCGDQTATCSVSVAFEDNLPDENLTIKFTANGWNGTDGAWVADIPEGAVNTAGAYSPGEGYGFETGDASKGNKAAVGANFSGDYTIVSRQLFTQDYFDANVASDIFLFQLHAEGATGMADNPRVDVAAFNNGNATYRAYNADGTAAANIWRTIPAFTAGTPVAVNFALAHESSGAWRLYADGNLIKSGTDSVAMPDTAMELWMPAILATTYASHPYVKHQVFLAYNVAKTDEEVRAVHTALYELFSGEAAAMYPLENGEYGSLTKIAVTNGNHVYATTTDTEEKYANISHVSSNSNWSLSELAQPKWFALKAGQSATLRLTNIVNDSGASFSVAFKAAESTTSTALKITEVTDATDKEVTVTVDEDTDIGCLMMYFQNPGSAIEFDVGLVVDGLKYI